VLFKGEHYSSEISERDILYKILFDMRKDITDLKKLVYDIMEHPDHTTEIKENNSQLLKKINESYEPILSKDPNITIHPKSEDHAIEPIEDSEVIEESLSLQKKEEFLIRKALEKHHGKRKNAAHDLGISERTLYRKIKEYEIE
jgi:transcriptional regulator with PAS, ATPase and Fis domain